MLPKSNMSAFEVRTSDLAGRIGNLKTKSSDFETPALLPVIHPVRQLVPCREIRSMGYEAVMTNAFTTFRRLKDSATENGIHRIIDYEGSVMTDSGGYQLLEFGEIDVSPTEIAEFEERIGSDIAIILDQPTGLDVTREFAISTVRNTLAAAKETERVLQREDVIWTLPIQGGKYIDLVSASAKASAKLDFGCYALGSPVEVMEEYDFPLLVRMILAAKAYLPGDRPFHLFGAGHPLILPTAIALGCDMFDSASYILYAKQDRYISSSGTIRLDKLEHLGCSCTICTSFRAAELKRLGKMERTIALARHNLYALKRVIEETKQAIWEGRLWEYMAANTKNHPKAFEAFKLATTLSGERFEWDTPAFKDRGIFVSEPTDESRPEIIRYRSKLMNLEISEEQDILVLVPETKKKPFLTSDIYHELCGVVPFKRALVACINENYGLIPAEISDIFPLSQTTSTFKNFPKDDPIIRWKSWKKIFVLLTKGHEDEEKWLSQEIEALSKKEKKAAKRRAEICRTHKEFKRKLSSIN